MTTAIALLAIALLLWPSISDWLARRRRGTAVPILREVVVHTQKPDDQTIRGLVDPAALEGRAPWLVLTAARYAQVNADTGEGSWVQVEGDVTLRADNVAFVQLLS